MKTNMKRLMIMTVVLLGVALILGTNASAIIIGTAPVAPGSTIIVGSVPPAGLVRPPVGLGLGLGLARPSLFNPFLIRPIFNPFLNPFIDLDDLLGIPPVGVGVTPGVVD